MLRSSVLTDPTVWALLLAQYVIHSLVSPFNNLRNSAELSDDCPFSRGLFLASPFPLTHSYETFWNLTTLFPCQQKKQSAAEAEYKKWEGKWRNESGRWKSKAEWRGYILYMSLVWIQCWIPPPPPLPECQRQGLSHSNTPTYAHTQDWQLKNTPIENEHRETVRSRQHAHDKTGFTFSGTAEHSYRICRRARSSVKLRLKQQTAFKHHADKLMFGSCV